MNIRNLIVAATVGASAALGTAAHAAGDDTPKQTVGEYASDTAITAKVKAAFVADKSLSALDVAVETTDGVVTLTGTVGTDTEADQAARVARDVEGVKQVKNEVKVDPAKAK